MPDYFEILGLPRRYPVDEGDLERRFHEQSKLLHPDRHAKADGVTRVKNALATSELNQAYRTLRDPVKRAEYLLGLSGIDVGNEQRRGSFPVDNSFLMEIMELRESLADARASGDAAKVESLAVAVRGDRDSAVRAVEQGFAAGENERVAAALVALRYYRRFLDEIDAWEESRADVNG